MSLQIQALFKLLTRFKPYTNEKGGVMGVDFLWHPISNPKIVSVVVLNFKNMTINAFALSQNCYITEYK